MASPQLENGFVRIANEILEQITLAGFSGGQTAIILTVLRRTYGYNRLDAPISITDFERATRRNRGNISRDLKTLEKRNILIRVAIPGIGTPAQWRLNKDWETWQGCDWSGLEDETRCTNLTRCTSTTRYQKTTQHVVVTQPPRCNNTTLYIRNKNKKEKDKEKDSSIAPSEKSLDAGSEQPSPKFDITIPLNDGTEYEIPLEEVHEWQRLYPAVDVVQQIRKIRGWNLSHPKKRKTRRGIKAHINSWLASEQDKGGQPGRPPPSPGKQSTADYWKQILENMED